MIPLMRRRTFLTKWALPYTIVALFLLWNWHQELAKPKPNYFVALFASFVLIIVAYFFVRRRSAVETDEVLDGGRFLKVTFGDRTEDVPMSNVARIETQRVILLTRMVLHLREPAEFGQTMSFYPIQSRNDSGENSVAASLEARMNGGGPGRAI